MMLIGLLMKVYVIQMYRFEKVDVVDNVNL